MEKATGTKETLTVTLVVKPTVACIHSSNPRTKALHVVVQVMRKSRVLSVVNCMIHVPIRAMHKYIFKMEQNTFRILLASNTSSTRDPTPTIGLLTKDASFLPFSLLYEQSTARTELLQTISWA